MRTVGALLLLALLAGCGTDTGGEPTATPVAALTTVHPVTVLDDGDALLGDGHRDEQLAPGRRQRRLAPAGARV